jgi:3-hydroxyacyl-CoA dehydrogenase
MSTTIPIRRVAIIGTGVIGASWAALFVAKGLEVVATGHRAGCRGCAATFRRWGLACAREVGPCARRISIEAGVHG